MLQGWSVEAISFSRLCASCWRKGRSRPLAQRPSAEATYLASTSFFACIWLINHFNYIHPDQSTDTTQINQSIDEDPFLNKTLENALLGSLTVSNLVKDFFRRHWFILYCQKRTNTIFYLHQLRALVELLFLHAMPSWSVERQSTQLETL